MAKHTFRLGDIDQGIAFRWTVAELTILRITHSVGFISQDRAVVTAHCDAATLTRIIGAIAHNG